MRMRINRKQKNIHFFVEYNFFLDIKRRVFCLSNYINVELQIRTFILLEKERERERKKESITNYNDLVDIS